MSDLSEFLELEASAGRFESSGVFTIDLEAQLRRLKGCLLASDTEAILKLIQALVGLQADDIQIHSDAFELSVYGRNTLPLELPEEPDPRQMQDGIPRDLLYGLAHLLQPAPARVGFSFWEKGKLVRWHPWVGGTAPPRLRRAPRSLEQGVGIHCQFDDDLGSYAIDAAELARRLFYAPCCIHFKGSLLGIRGNEKFFQEMTDFSGVGMIEYYAPLRAPRGRIAPRCLGPTSTDLSPGLDWPGVTKHNGPVSKIRSFGVATVDPGTRFSEKGRFLTIAEGAALVFDEENALSTSWIFPVKRGVFLSPLRWNSRGGTVACVVVDDELPTDLGQFQVLDSERALLEARARALVCEALEVGMANPAPISQSIFRKSEVLAVIGITVLATCLGGPAVIVPSLLASLVGVSIHHDRVYGKREQAAVGESLGGWLGGC